jgi:hypothetical protein
MHLSIVPPRPPPKKKPKCRNDSEMWVVFPLEFMLINPDSWVLNLSLLIYFKTLQVRFNSAGLSIVPNTKELPPPL